MTTKSIHTADADHTVPSLATGILSAIVKDETIPGHPTGEPHYRGDVIDAVKWGMTLDQITWSGDRGNWMWDGALATLRVLGVDTSAPL